MQARCPVKIEHVKLAQAELRNVRVPFQRSQRAWVIPGNPRRCVRIGGRGSLPVGAVELGNGEWLDLHSGVVYRVVVSDAEAGAA